MKVNIISDEEWDIRVSTHPQSTVYHTRPWIEAWQKMYPGSRAVCYSFQNAKGEIHYVTGLKRKLFGGLAVRFDSGPEGTYGGILSSQDTISEEIRFIFDYLKNHFSFYTRQIADNNEPNGVLTAMDATRVIDLSKNNGKNPYNQNTTRNIKKAENAGLVIREASDPKQWEKYYAMYRSGLPRWNKPENSAYSFDLFENIRTDHRLPKKLWLAYDHDTILYGCLVFYHRQTAFYWHGAGNENGLKTGASFLLHEHIIQNARENGYLFYDFMPSGGKESLIQFKDGFNPEKVPLYGLNYKTKWYKIMEAMAIFKNRVL